MKTVGKILLLIAGIVLLVIGVWGLVSACIALGGAVKAFVADHEEISLLVAAIIAVGVAAIILILYLFAGIRGIKASTKGDHKNVTKAFIWAIVILVFSIIGFIGNKGALASNIAGTIVSAAYVVGAFFVKLCK